jgi:superfamily II DNA or RNA helicase
MQLGSIRHTISVAAETKRRQLVPALVIRDTGFTLPVDESRSLPIQSIYGLLGADHLRNDLIFNDVLSALEEGRSPLVLTERTDHLSYLAERLSKFTRNLIVLRGGMGQKLRRNALARLSMIPDNEERLVIATGRYAGEGFDDPRLDTLFLTMPISWKGRLVQYVGRLHRTYADKRDIRVYDYVDSRLPVLSKMFERRMQGYRAMGYTSVSTPPL